jgi:hypothetical protein
MPRLSSKHQVLRMMIDIAPNEIFDASIPYLTRTKPLKNKWKYVIYKNRNARIRKVFRQYGIASEPRVIGRR